MPIDLNPHQSGPQLLDVGLLKMEVWVDPVVGPRKGLAVVLHPQPLLGGHSRHKVPEYLAKGLVAQGWTTLRPNFRGVGQSTGEHSEGSGETEDVLALVQMLRRDNPSDRLVLIGFSFGAFVGACVSRALADTGQAAWRTCLAGMPFGEVAGGRRYDTPGELPDALVVHGECDDRVPLGSVMDWARSSGQPVVVIPGADHFFSGRLPQLRDLVLHQLN
jgi:uncharacterized protein